MEAHDNNSRTQYSMPIFDLMLKAGKSHAREGFGSMRGWKPDHAGAGSGWPGRRIVIGGNDPMPAELSCDDGDSDKDLHGLADSSSNNDALPGREGPGPVGDAQLAQCSALTRALEVAEVQVPRIRQSSILALARSDMSTRVDRRVRTFVDCAGTRRCRLG